MKRDVPKGWTSAYWDILEQVYWVPPYIGMKSIPRKLWQTHGDRVSVPSIMTSSNGPLYFREKKTADFWPYIQRQEETFNHQFELFASLLSPEDLALVLAPICGLPQGLAISPLGRSTNSHLKWSEMGNYTQPDLFLRGPSAIAMIELKFNAKTNMDQFGKYLALIARDDDLYGGKPLRRLTYILASREPVMALEKQLGQSIRDISQLAPETIATHVKNAKVASYLRENPDPVRRAITQTQINAVSWQALHDRLVEVSKQADNKPGVRTFCRILSGMAEAVLMHPLSKVKRANSDLR